MARANGLRVLDNALLVREMMSGSLKLFCGLNCYQRGGDAIKMLMIACRSSLKECVHEWLKVWRWKMFKRDGYEGRRRMLTRWNTRAG